MAYPAITFQVKLYDISEVLSSTPVEDLTNRLIQLNERTIQIPGVEGNLHHGDQFVLYGSQATAIQNILKSTLQVLEITTYNNVVFNAPIIEIDFSNDYSDDYTS